MTNTIRSRRFEGALASIAYAMMIVGVLFFASSTWAAVNTFREGVSGYADTQDTYLDEQFPDTSQGSANNILVENNAGQRQHGLIRFDNIFGGGAGQIPFGSVINSASLTINVDNVSDPAAQIRLHRMLVTWAETATWNSMTGGIQTNDIEAMTAFDAQVTDPASLGPETITGLTAALQAWSDGTSNFGWAIISNETDGWDFFSSEDATTGNRPLLTVDWSPPVVAGMYYWQDDSGTSVAGFTTDSTGCGNSERDLFLITLMSTGGFNCTDFMHERRDPPPPQNMWLMIKDTAYPVATDVTGIDFALDFLDDASGGVTARYELGYAQAGVFTSWGFADEGPHEPEALYVTDLSSISGMAPAGSNLALRIVDVAPGSGDMRIFTGSDFSSGILNVTEVVAAGCPGGVVTTTANSGFASLRDCIDFANINPGTTISFNIPGPGNRSAGGDTWWAIAPASPLPTITAASTIIDGTTQTVNQGDTNSLGPEIELDGTSAGGGAHGLVIGGAGDSSTIRALMINRFSTNGIQLNAGADGLIIAGNWIGSDGSGASAPGNGNNGINVLGGSATIGGTGAGDPNVINNNGNEGINLTGGGATGNAILGNIIGLEYDGTSGSGNGDVGIAILSGASGNTIGGLTASSRNVISMNFEGIEINSPNNTVIGNYIGTDSGGTLDRGNRSDDAIEINSSVTGNTIGGTAAGAGNLIAFNQRHGVNVTGGSDSTILGNRIRSNNLRGIDLGNNGVTANDPGDGDGGPNGLLNFPVITFANESGGTIDVDFDLDVPAGDYRIEFFTNPSGADSSGNGEGELFADTVTINHGGTGVELFNHSFAGSAGDIITATTTEEFAGPTYGSTSEFSAAFTVTSLPVCPGGVVTTTVDSVAGGSLRACIIWANGNPGADTLTLPAGTYTLTRAGTDEEAAVTGDLDITDDIIINGNAVSPTIIDANALDRSIDVRASTATISNIEFRDGLTVGRGGGVSVDASGSLTLSNATVNGNTANADGGGISTVGGAVALTNVTVSGNTADRGGGIDCAGPCTLTNVTVTANTAPSNGGGVRQRTGSGSFTFLNTIVANNVSTGAVNCDGNPSLLFSNGNNLSSDATCDFTSPGDQENTDPLVGLLQDNGGPTFTHQLLLGSPAIDTGTNTGCPATDQRGIARPIGPTCDIGSFEAALPPACPAGVVTTFADSGASSLRDCIIIANGSPGSTISFNIPGPGNRSSGGDTWWGIAVSSPLPTVTAATTVIDATTQTTNQGNTNSRGPEIEIDGAGAGAIANGLVIGATAGGSTIRGLAIGNFIDNGILLLGGSNLIAGNYIGLSADGDSVAANNSDATMQEGGIRVESASNTIGGTAAADRNILSGNGFAGVDFVGASASGNMVYGNYIGIDATGAAGRANTQEGIDLELAGGNIIGGPLAGQRNIISGNDSDGIEIDAGDSNIVQNNYIGTDVSGTVIIANGRDGIDINENGSDGAMTNVIGGANANEGNLIRGNTIYGIQVRGAAPSNNSILGNRIYGNVELDVDLNDDDITANDPLDADSGSNDLLNYPEIVAAPVSGGTITAYFALDVPAGDYRIEFFTNPSGAHADGNGGGELFAGATTITHAGAGVQYFAHSFPGSTGDIITAATTEQLAGPTYNSTSEFSTAFTATAFSPFTARWPLDETSGIIAADIDSGNDGTYRNGVLLNQAAACLNTANAAYFDGVDDFVEVPHSPDYLMNEGTVTFWANADAVGAQQALFSKDSTGFDTGGHLTVLIQADGTVRVRLQTNSGDNFVTGPAVTPGTWFHVAFSWGPAGMALSVDGAAPVTDPYTGGLGITSGGAGNFEPISFGASSWVSDDLLVTPTVEHFAGYLDDVRINNRALTQPEIVTLANCAGSLDIVKRAFWPDGTPIPTGATIPNGVEFKYMLYVNNPSVARTDVTVRDVLDPAFQYQTGNIQVDNTVGECAAVACTPVEEQTIFAAVDGAAVLTDTADGDVASYTGASTSVDAGNGNVANLQLDINGSAVWAILFSAKMP